MVMKIGGSCGFGVEEGGEEDLIGLIFNHFAH